MGRVMIVTIKHFPLAVLISIIFNAFAEFASTTLDLKRLAKRLCRYTYYTRIVYH